MKTRKDYMDLLSAKLKEIDAKIDLLEKKADVERAKLRIAYNRQLKDLREKRKKADIQLGRIKEASDEAWADIKKDADRLIEDVKRFFKKAA